MAKKTKIKLPKDLKGVKFTTPVFRLSFPKLFKKEAFAEGQRESYSMAMLFKKDADLSEMKKHIIKAASEAFGPDKKKWPKNLSLPWRDGDENSDYDGYENCYYCSAKSYNKIVVIDRQKEKIEDGDDIYGGCYARAVLVAKATEAGGKYYVSLYIQGVQKIRDGEPFGSGVNIDEDFGDIDDDELPDDGDDPDDYEDSDDDNDMGF